jgi:hypothetical protein
MDVMVPRKEPAKTQTAEPASVEAPQKDVAPSTSAPMDTIIIDGNSSTATTTVKLGNPLTKENEQDLWKSPYDWSVSDLIALTDDVEP